MTWKVLPDTTQCTLDYQYAS